MDRLPSLPRSPSKFARPMGRNHVTLFEAVEAGDVVADAPAGGGGELPEGWTWATLGDLAADLANGFGKRQQAAGTPRLVLRLADLRKGEISLDEARRINATTAEVQQFGLRPD